MKKPATKTGKASNAREEEEDEVEEEGNEVEEEKASASNNRGRRAAAIKIKTEPVSPPSSRPTRTKATASNLSNGKPPSRNAKKTYQESSESEEEPLPKSSRLAAKKQELKAKPTKRTRDDSESESEDTQPLKKSNRSGSKQPEVGQTRFARKVIAPVRFESDAHNPKPGPKSSKNAGKEERAKRLMKRTEPESAKKKVSARQVGKRQPPVELQEYECETCSQTFYSQVASELHKLEHEGRYFTLKLERCAVPLSENSSSELEDDASSSGESRRKPRKPQKPIKNAARDRLNNQADSDGNFVFVAPLRLPGPKSMKEKNGENISYEFEKPTDVSPENKDNEFSDDEEESVTENVDDVISSLENSDPTQDKAEEGEKVEEETKNTEKTENDGESESEEQNKEAKVSPKPVNINQALSFDFEAPAPVTKPAVESPTVNKQNCLKFDFEEPTTEEPKTPSAINTISALSFDFDPPVEKNSPDKIVPLMTTKNSSDKASENSSEYLSTENEFAGDDGAVGSALSDSFISTEDPSVDNVSMMSSNIDTTYALRDDSSNPTLPQPQRQPRDSSSPFNSAEQSSSDLGSLEKMVAEVVGHN